MLMPACGVLMLPRRRSRARGKKGGKGNRITKLFHAPRVARARKHPNPVRAASRKPPAELRLRTQPGVEPNEVRS